MHVVIGYNLFINKSIVQKQKYMYKSINKSNVFTPPHAPPFTSLSPGCSPPPLNNFLHLSQFWVDSIEHLS